MKNGDILLVQFPFTDLSGSKLRPALAITNISYEGDMILAFISSRFGKRGYSDVHLKKTDDDFDITHLKTNSVIKTNKVMTLNKKIIKGKIGCISIIKIKEFHEKFKYYLDYN